jgi:predicted homoserine dehydrogenase-like protein
MITLAGPGEPLNVSILSAALPGKPTGATLDFAGDVAATAKRDLAAGERLDGEGGFTVYGKLLPAATSLQRGALPIGLAHGVTLKNPVKAGDTLRWADVTVDESVEAVQVRRAMEARFHNAGGEAAQ